MSRPLRFEAKTMEAARDRARQRLGTDVSELVVLRHGRELSGGLFGFFQRERFVIEVEDPRSKPSRPARSGAITSPVAAAQPVRSQDIPVPDRLAALLESTTDTVGVSFDRGAAGRSRRRTGSRVGRGRDGGLRVRLGRASWPAYYPPAAATPSAGRIAFPGEQDLRHLVQGPPLFGRPLRGIPAGPALLPARARAPLAARGHPGSLPAPPPGPSRHCAALLSGLPAWLSRPRPKALMQEGDLLRVDKTTCCVATGSPTETRPITHTRARLLPLPRTATRSLRCIPRSDFTKPARRRRATSPFTPRSPRTCTWFFQGLDEDTGKAVVEVFVNPLVVWVWIGGIVVFLGTLLALYPSRVAREISENSRAQDIAVSAGDAG